MRNKISFLERTHFSSYMRKDVKTWLTETAKKHNSSRARELENILIREMEKQK